MNRLVSVSENISNTRVAMGDFNGALVDLGMLKEVCIDQNSRKHVASVNAKISVVLDLAGQPEEAKVLRGGALEFMNETRTAKRDRICLSVNEGCHLMLNGHFKEARLLFESAIKVSMFPIFLNLFFSLILLCACRSLLLPQSSVDCKSARFKMPFQRCFTILVRVICWKETSRSRCRCFTARWTSSASATESKALMQRFAISTWVLRILMIPMAFEWPRYTHITVP